MPISQETVLSHVGAYVVAVDRERNILYSNRGDAGSPRLAAPVLAEAIDRSFARGEGFAPTEMELVLPEAGCGNGAARMLASGRLAAADGKAVMIVTVMPLPAGCAAADDEASRTRAAYLANICHDIRTPLNAISGFSKLMAKTSDRDKLAQYADVIETNNTLLLQLIDNVLDIARMQEGKLEFNKDKVDLNEFVRSMESTVRLRVQPGAILNYVLGSAECVVETDKERLSQLLLNLLTNACKFTPRGSITFGYEVHDDHIYFFVKDTGIGIPKEKQEHLFKRFWKQSGSTPGNGLGLSICKEIADGLGGEIGMESAGEGRGSLFWFTLPVRPIESGAYPSAAPSAQGRREPAREAAPAPVIRKDRPTILVAEDNESNYFLFSSILEDDYNLIHAWDGREAVELFPQHKPDLVLMDINMPRMDGYEATRRIRQVSETVPIIAVTAYAFSSDRTRIMENGFSSYVSKPVNADRLVAEIRKLLAE